MIRERTLEYKRMRDMDVSKIQTFNNSKESRRSNYENWVALVNKESYYFRKWTLLFSNAETPAQKEIAKDVLQRILIIRHRAAFYFSEYQKEMEEILK